MKVLLLLSLLLPACVTRTSTAPDGTTTITKELDAGLFSKTLETIVVLSAPSGK